VDDPAVTRRPGPPLSGERDPATESSSSPAAPRGADRSPRLDVLKALGDNTRYAIYLELARSPLPLATAEVADALDLHVNTVRPHLERMRDVGLLAVDTETRGTVGRPQHRWSVSPDAPSLGLEPSPWPTLARTLLAAAAAGGLDPADLADAGRRQGRADAAQWPSDSECLDGLVVEQARLGFDPATLEEPDRATVAFAHCPFRDLALEHPQLVCALHGGLVEGFVAAWPDCSVERFHALVDRSPCQVDLVLAATDPEPA
jgi:predicted ArsR family transcriptional regulator